MRGNGGVAVAIAEPDGIAEEEQDFVEARAAHHGLVIVVADGVVVGQILGVRGVALLHVVKAHRRCAFASGYFTGSVIPAEVRGLGLPVIVGTHGHFRSGKQIGEATVRMRLRDV